MRLASVAKQLAAALLPGLLPMDHYQQQGWETTCHAAAAGQRCCCAHHSLQRQAGAEWISTGCISKARRHKRPAAAPLTEAPALLPCCC